MTIELACDFECTGCCSCASCCPKSAIKMVENDNGFLHPVIDEDSCIECGLCMKSCPIINQREGNEPSSNVFAVMADDTVREKSASGGVFKILANMIVENGGYVCGAVWDFENLRVKHIITNNLDDLVQMQGSKYVQSELGTCFCEIKKILTEKKQVLFCGTPCQVAGLNSYLGRCYDNLLTADIICFGVPSPKVFRKYVSENIDIKNEKILKLDFRSKKYGWSPNYVAEISTSLKKIEEPASKNVYLKAFLSSLSTRDCCQDCHFANRNRPGDITLGDFWWIENYKKELNDGKGTSLVIVNNEKGKKFFDMCRQEMLVKEVDFSHVTNLTLFRPSDAHKNRKQFYADLDKKKLSDNVNECLKDNFDIGIMNFWWAVTNYGALLTGYALQQFLEDLGYNTRLIDNKFMNYKKDSEYNGSFNEKFRNKYLKTTKPLKTDSDYKDLSEKAKIFITGSDQVFNPKWTGPLYKKYFLNFAGLNAKKLAISASFGIGDDEFNYDPNVVGFMKKSLQSFDYVSVREDAGIKICEEQLDVKAEQLIDPVFWISKEKYENILKSSDQDYSNDIVSYVLDTNGDYEKVYDHLQEKYSCKVRTIQGKNLSVEEWLKAIYECRYFITDSFHGLCFALIFNKPFICIINKHRGYARFSSMMKLFNLKSGFFENILECVNENSFYCPDSAAVNSTIENEMLKARDKMKAILSEESDRSCQKMMFRLFELENENNLLAKTLFLMSKESKLRKKLIKYKLLSFISFGKKKKKYKAKRKEAKAMLKEIGQLVKQCYSGDK